jgi:hypothetical protein
VVDTAHTWNTKNIVNKLVQMRELMAAGIPPVEGVNLIERLAGDPEVSKFIAGRSSLVTAREIHFLWGTKVGLGSHCVRYVSRCWRRIENVIMCFE